MATRSEYFSVQVKSREVIRAESELPEFRLPLSNLDLLLPPAGASIYFIYRKPSNINYNDLSFDSVAEILKKSLARVLVHYYPFAGQMVPNSINGEQEVCCNNSGVEFIQAHADVELSGLILHDPDATVQGKLVPTGELGVLSVQVTKLKCEGIIVACTIDHRVADAHSISMFAASWAEMARTNSLTLIPNFSRSILSPCRPGFYDKFVNTMYTSLASPQSEPNASPDQFTRIYHLSSEDLDQLQSLASTDESRRTKLEALSAYIWKLIANTSEDTDICMLGITVDGRTHLAGGEMLKKMRYIGNVVSVPFGEAIAEELKRESLHLVAEQIHEFISCATNKEHFQELIDYIEERKPKPIIPKFYYNGTKDGPAITISDGRFLDLKSIDFGFGPPFHASFHFLANVNNTGFVMPLFSPLGNGDWIIYMILNKIQMHEVETVHRDIFHPLTAEHLAPAWR